MSNDAITDALSKLSYDVPGFRVVGADRNACPRHYGVFVERADAEAYLAAVEADAEAEGSPAQFRVKFLAAKGRR